MHATPPPARPLRLLLRVPVPWVFVLAYLAGIGLQALLPAPSLSASAHWAALLLGAAVFLAGAIVAGWPLVLFHREGTTTTPGERSNALVTRGPYRFTRNPMYVGLTLAYLGEMGLLRQIAPAATLVLVLVYVDRIVIPLEEVRLRDAFGGAYAEYCSRVRRWL